MTISSQVIEVLNELCKKFGIAIDWSAENVLPYVKELAGKFISLEIATSWAWIVIAVIFIAISILFIILDMKYNFDGFLCVIGTIIIVIVLFVIAAQAFDIITCKYFPEKKIFEYVQYMIKNS